MIYGPLYLNYYDNGYKVIDVMKFATVGGKLCFGGVPCKEGEVYKVPCGGLVSCATIELQCAVLHKDNNGRWYLSGFEGYDINDMLAKRV